MLCFLKKKTNRFFFDVKNLVVNDYFSTKNIAKIKNFNYDWS